MFHSSQHLRSFTKSHDYSSMNTHTFYEDVILKDSLLHDVVTLTMSVFVSADDLLSLTALKMTACIYNISSDFSVTWQKIMMTNSIADFIFFCACSYDLNLSSLLKVTNDINAFMILFCEKHLKSKNRKYLKNILKSI